MSDHLPMADLARRWSELLISDVEQGEVLVPAAAAAGTLLRTGASEEDIVATERRLGRELPPSYREFLTVSDGAFGDLYGASTWVQQTEQTDVAGVGLLPVRDLQWLVDVEPEMAEGCRLTGAATDVGRPATFDKEAPGLWKPMADGLVIGVERAPGTTCLVPFEGEAEWQVWNIHKETSEAYLSFRSFLERMVAEREPLTTLQDLRSALAAAAGGDPIARRRLRKVTAPGAVPVLEAALVQGDPFALPALSGLAGVATPEAVGAMARHRSPGVENFLVAAGTPAAADVLDDWNCFAQLASLGDPRAADCATRVLRAAVGSAPSPDERRALQVLGESQEPEAVDVLLSFLSSEPLTAADAAFALARRGVDTGRLKLAEIAASIAVGPGVPPAYYASTLLTRLGDEPT